MGIIQINGWDGASFSDRDISSAFPVGQTEFPFAFKNRISESNTPRPDRSASPAAGGVFVPYLTRFQHMLHEQAHGKRCRPSSKSQGRAVLPPVLMMRYSMFVFKPTRAHGEDDEELAQCFEREKRMRKHRERLQLL